MTAIAPSLVDNCNFSRGTIVAWDPNTCNVKKCAVNCTSGFEISLLKVESGFDHFYMISAYCSPSQSRPRYNEFFSALVDTIAFSQGKLLVVGDLNIQAKRKLHHFSDEAEFIRMIERTGLKNEIKAITHPSNNNQLDYAFSNIDGLHGRTVDGFGDHLGFSIDVNIKLEVVQVPEMVVPTNRDAISSFTITALVEAQVERIISKDLDIGEAILELELFLWELNEEIYEYRIIPAHTRVKDCSRQMSATIFNEDLADAEKRRLLRENLEKDTARKLEKRLRSLDGSERLMSAFTLGSKKKPILECNVDPDQFFDSVMADEKEAMSSRPDVPKGAMADIIVPLDDRRLEYAVKKARSKWITKGGFSARFWTYIGTKLFTEKDKGVYSFANVGTVIKDKTNYTEAKAWRMVWKASSLCEKIYDLLRACAVDSSQLNNDAYCIGRSTARTLSKVSGWPMTDDWAALGCDFKNAFGLASRETVNELLGFDFINPKIDFQVYTKAGKSAVGTSTSVLVSLILASAI